MLCADLECPERSLRIMGHNFKVFTSVGNPKAKGRTKVTNRILLQNLKTKLGKDKTNWVHEILEILWAYRTMPRSSTSETPFLLTYGSKTLMSSEIVEPTGRIIRYDEKLNEQARSYGFDLIETSQINAKLKMENYK
ncbi:UNVERIFIED_CONTAM: hypothetical protein Sindi_0161500 [Sesamum indicum]